jgi:hypothetical protein
MFRCFPRGDSSALRRLFARPFARDFHPAFIRRSFSLVRRIKLVVSLSIEYHFQQSHDRSPSSSLFFESWFVRKRSRRRGSKHRSRYLRDSLGDIAILSDQSDKRNSHLLWFHLTMIRETRVSKPWINHGSEPPRLPVSPSPRLPCSPFSSCSPVFRSLRLVRSSEVESRPYRTKLRSLPDGAVRSPGYIAGSAVFSLFMWRNRIKTVATSWVPRWDYSRTVTPGNANPM